MSAQPRLTDTPDETMNARDSCRRLAGHCHAWPRVLMTMSGLLPMWFKFRQLKSVRQENKGAYEGSRLNQDLSPVWWGWGLRWRDARGCQSWAFHRDRKSLARLGARLVKTEPPRDPGLRVILIM